MTIADPQAYRYLSTACWRTRKPRQQRRRESFARVPSWQAPTLPWIIMAELVIRVLISPGTPQFFAVPRLARRLYGPGQARFRPENARFDRLNLGRAREGKLWANLGSACWKRRPEEMCMPRILFSPAAPRPLTRLLSLPSVPGNWTLRASRAATRSSGRFTTGPLRYSGRTFAGVGRKGAYAGGRQGGAKIPEIPTAPALIEAGKTSK